MIVETGYSYAWPIPNTTVNYTSTYPYTEEGQRRFTADLVSMLKGHDSVTGLLWWWPEDNGNKGVTDGWWNAALYDHNSGKPYAAFYELKAFAPNTSSLSPVDVNVDVNVNSYWYSLQGAKLDTRPQRRGFYIHNRRKVIVI
jgi:arabinogalactan endo-1,4-beta-galactosidase